MKNGHGRLEQTAFTQDSNEIQHPCNFHEMCYQCYERNNLNRF